MDGTHRQVPTMVVLAYQSEVVVLLEYFLSSKTIVVDQSETKFAQITSDRIVQCQ